MNCYQFNLPSLNGWFFEVFSNTVHVRYGESVANEAVLPVNFIAHSLANNIHCQ